MDGTATSDPYISARGDLLVLFAATVAAAATVAVVLVP